MAQLRAEFATIDQLAADQGSHAGNIESLRATLRAHVSTALDNFAGGLGQAEHTACMAKADQLIDEYIENVRTFQSTTNRVNDTFQHGGRQAQNILGSGA
ncbi:MAG TPA: hypothetical protein VFC00_04775 [Micromonosporaceae bacterium]|nr:hypothetical protein [Micromonosporaceae bacterium]